MADNPIDDSRDNSTLKSKADSKPSKKGKEVSSRYMNPVVRTPKTPNRPETPTKANASGSNPSKSVVSTPPRPPKSRPKSAERPVRRAKPEDLSVETSALIDAINARTARIMVVNMEVAREKVKNEALRQLRVKALHLIELMSDTTNNRRAKFEERVTKAAREMVSSYGDVESVQILIQSATVKLRILSQAVLYKANFVPFSGQLYFPWSSDDEGQAVVATELIQYCKTFQSVLDRIAKLASLDVIEELSVAMKKFCDSVKSLGDGIEVDSLVAQRFLDLFVDFVYSVEFATVLHRQIEDHENVLDVLHQRS